MFLRKNNLFKSKKAEFIINKSLFMIQKNYNYFYNDFVKFCVIIIVIS